MNPSPDDKSSLGSAGGKGGEREREEPHSPPLVSLGSSGPPPCTPWSFSVWDGRATAISSSDSQAGGEGTKEHKNTRGKEEEEER